MSTRAKIISSGTISQSYIFVERISDGLIRLSNPRWGVQIWTLGTVRGERPCAVTGEQLKGRRAYRPITNKGNRYQRISAEVIEKAEKSIKGG